MGFFSWFGPAPANSKTAQEMKEEAMGKLEKAYMAGHQGQAGQYSSAATPSQPQPPVWTAEDQKELDILESDLKHRNEEERQKYFMSLPEDIRLSIIEAYKVQAVNYAMEQLSHNRAHMSQRHMELQSKHYRSQNHMHVLMKSRDEHGEKSFQLYEQLCKFHAEAATNEILLNDKK